MVPARADEVKTWQYHPRIVQIDLRESWRIRDVEIPTRVVLAPMAGVSVQAFRRQGRRFGAGLVCSEMVSCAGIEHRNEKTLGYLRVATDEHPLAIQIFGSEPRVMADAARMVEAAGADLVDINFGCPVRKVTKTGAGATLLDEPARAAAIVEAVARRRLGPGLREDAARPPRRLAHLSRGRPAARRRRRGHADAAPSLGAADVHRDRRPHPHRRARLAGRRAGDRLRRRHLARPGPGRARDDRRGCRDGRARRPGQPVGAPRDRRRRRPRADPRGGRRGARPLHPRDRPRAGRAARVRVPEEVLRLVSRPRAASRSRSSRSWSCSTRPPRWSAC